VISDLQSGIREVVTDRVGMRVPVGDVPAAADAIISLVRSPQRLVELSAAASESARRQYSATRMAERYLDLIGRLAKAQAVWPADVRVEPPMMLNHQWLYRGPARRVRRFFQRLRKS
jgi:hypothetical protein